MTLSNNQLKFINSLQLKKYRQREQAFLVEGAKNVLELLAARWPVKLVAATAAFAEMHAAALADVPVFEVTEDQLAKLGTFQTNNAALAVGVMPETGLIGKPNEYILALDRISDPGNLGTILRIADWYGFRHVVCSHQTADLYNPKVLAASMGSYLRLKVYYDDLATLLPKLGMPIYAADLAGDDVHTLAWSRPGGIILMGSESEGLHPELRALAHHRITIPRYGQAESLNVAMATAIICDNLRRTS